jgi:hypothetical protein
MKTPVAIFTYNRPEHAQRLFESLAVNARLDECEVVIYCDGPKMAEHEAAVKASRAVVREWAGRLNARVIEKANNAGLAKSIVEGVTGLCSEYGQVIVLEDDLVVSPYFLEFMLAGLRRYANDSQVMQISGHMFPVAHSNKEDGIFLPYSVTWGWATWERAWRAFSWEGKRTIELLQDQAVRHRFDFNGAHPYSALLEARLAGKNQSWGILWYWAVFCAGGMVLHPRLSLVRNEGFDGSGTHCRTDHYYKEPSIEEFNTRWLSAPVRMPQEIKIDDCAMARVSELLRCRDVGIMRSDGLRRLWHTGKAILGKWIFRNNKCNC